MSAPMQQREGWLRTASPEDIVAAQERGELAELLGAEPDQDEE